MAVEGITGSNAILLSTLGGLQGTLLRRVPIHPGGTNPATAAAASTGNVFQRNVQPVAIAQQNVSAAFSAPVTTSLAATTIAAATVPFDQVTIQPNVVQVTVPPQAVGEPAAPVTSPLPPPVIVPPVPLQISLANQNPGVQAPTQTEPRQASSPAPPRAAQATLPTFNIIPPNALQVAVPLQNVTIEAAPPLGATQLNTLVAAGAEEAAATVSEAVRQSALLVNEALRNVGFTAIAPTETEPLLFTAPSPFLAALLEARELTAVQQNALLVSETLQNLNFIPAEQINPLLINELPPALEAVGITEGLNITGQNRLLVNEILLDVGLAAPIGTTQTQQPLAPIAQTAVTTEGQTAVVQTPAAQQNATVTPAAAQPAAVATAITAAPTAPVATATTPATEVTIPVAAAFQRLGFTPATFPLTLFPDRTPYPLIVFQPNDPAPLPRPPEPVSREVAPTTPVAGTRMVGDARLRQLRLRTGGRMGNVEYYTPQATVGQAEKSIRYALGQVNAAMAAQDSPLHLVFARHENGFALDVYDCSYNEACRLAYDVPIPLDNLPEVLGNLEHEAGIIVDRTS